MEPLAKRRVDGNLDIALFDRAACHAAKTGRKTAIAETPSNI
ncbi:hypothetical protein PCAR4_1280002 [Paraburkholderia caribensis]|nr:hypothetical protein PCAR4_1280002 [Paraburkholderia caribensis]